MESVTIFPEVNHVSAYFFTQFIVSITGGSVIWIIEANNGYLAIKTLNFNKTLIHPSMMYYLKKNILYPQIFYFSYTMFIQNMWFYLYFSYKSYVKVKRKKLYFEHIKKTMAYSILFTSQFMIWYYVFAWNGFPILFLNIVSFVSMLEPFFQYNLLKKHHETINTMNIYENEAEVLSYVDNPLNGYDLELRNIVIR